MNTQGTLIAGVLVSRLTPADAVRKAEIMSEMSRSDCGAAFRMLGYAKGEASTTANLIFTTLTYIEQLDVAISKCKTKDLEIAPSKAKAKAKAETKSEQPDAPDEVKYAE